MLHFTCNTARKIFGFFRHGIEIRKFSFSGKVIETIRGERPEKDYSYAGFTLRFWDMGAPEFPKES